MRVNEGVWSEIGRWLIPFQKTKSGPGFPAAAAASNRSVFSGYLTKETMRQPLQKTSKKRFRNSAASHVILTDYNFEPPSGPKTQKRLEKLQN